MPNLYSRAYRVGILIFISSCLITIVTIAQPADNDVVNLIKDDLHLTGQVRIVKDISQIGYGIRLNNETSYKLVDLRAFSIGSRQFVIHHEVLKVQGKISAKPRLLERVHPGTITTYQNYNPHAAAVSYQFFQKKNGPIQIVTHQTLREALLDNEVSMGLLGKSQNWETMRWATLIAGMGLLAYGAYDEYGDYIKGNEFNMTWMIGSGIGLSASSLFFSARSRHYLRNAVDTYNK